jgi:hypothetical protein
MIWKDYLSPKYIETNKSSRENIKPKFKEGRQTGINYTLKEANLSISSESYTDSFVLSQRTLRQTSKIAFTYGTIHIQTTFNVKKNYNKKHSVVDPDQDLINNKK